MPLADLLENPEALSAFLTPSAFRLPASPEAAEAMRQLQRRAITGLEQLLIEEPAAVRDKIEQALYDRAAEVINRQATDLGRDIRESFFGRGVGASTMTTDMLGRLAREQLDALGRARREAFLGAGAESRASQAARLSALGSAYGAGTTGLQAEAGVGLTQTGREQQARQAAAQETFQNLLTRLGREQQAGQFGRELESRERLQERGFETAENIAERGMLATGIGAGIGGLARLFGPGLSSWFTRLMGG